MPTTLRMKASTTGGSMSNNAVKVKTLKAHAVLAELRQEGRYERNLARFDADDDLLSMPNPMDSAQARRAAK